MTQPDVTIGIVLLFFSAAILVASLRVALLLSIVSVAGVGFWMLLWIGALEGVLYVTGESEPLAGAVTALVSTAPGQLLFGSLIGLLTLVVPCASALPFRSRMRAGGSLVASLVCSIGAAIALRPVMLPGVGAPALLWVVYGGAAVLAFVYAPLSARLGTGLYYRR